MYKSEWACLLGPCLWGVLEPTEVHPPQSSVSFTGRLLHSPCLFLPLAYAAAAPFPLSPVSPNINSPVSPKVQFLPEPFPSHLGSSCSPPYYSYWPLHQVAQKQLLPSSNVLTSPDCLSCCFFKLPCLLHKEAGSCLYFCIPIMCYIQNRNVILLNGSDCLWIRDNPI